MLREEAQRRAQSRLPAPRLARNVQPGQTVDLDVSPRLMAGGGSGDAKKVSGRGGNDRLAVGKDFGLRILGKRDDRLAA